MEMLQTLVAEAEVQEELPAQAEQTNTEAQVEHMVEDTVVLNQKEHKVLVVQVQ